MNSTARERQIINQYRLRMTAALLVYGGLLVLTLLVIGENPDAWWRFAVALIPVLPFAYGAFAVLQYVRDVDELKRQITVETLALAFAGSSIVTFAVGFLQIAGAPAINCTFVWMVMGACWVLAGLVAGRRFR